MHQSLFRKAARPKDQKPLPLRQEKTLINRIENTAYLNPFALPAGRQGMQTIHN